jgi:tether containing UBX domain for GLUT4
MLEGSFPSTSKISDVYQFVKESLQEDVRTKPFILCRSHLSRRSPTWLWFPARSTLKNLTIPSFYFFYCIPDQTPPRREFLLKDAKIRSSNLLDLQLAPSSLLLIKFTDEIYNRTFFRVSSFFFFFSYVWKLRLMWQILDFFFLKIRLIGRL